MFFLVKRYNIEQKYQGLITKMILVSLAATYKIDALRSGVYMDTKQDVRDRVRRLDEQLAQYISPRENWNPADESLYKPVD